MVAAWHQNEEHEDQAEAQDASKVKGKAGCFREGAGRKERERERGGEEEDRRAGGREKGEGGGGEGAPQTSPSPLPGKISFLLKNSNNDPPLYPFPF